MRRGLGKGPWAWPLGRRNREAGRARQRLREREIDKRATQGVGDGDCETYRG